MSAISLNSNNFEEIVLNSDKPVLVDFWAAWCGPCRMQSPVIEELADELEDSAVVAKLNVDENPELAARFSVMSIPTLVIVRNGKTVGRRTGVTPKETLLSMLDSAGASVSGLFPAAFLNQSAQSGRATASAGRRFPDISESG